MRKKKGIRVIKEPIKNRVQPRAKGVYSFIRECVHFLLYHLLAFKIFVFGVLCRNLFAFKLANGKTLTMAVFVYRIGSLGDAVVSIPAIKQIKEMQQNKQIYLITNISNEGIVNTWDVLEHIGVFKSYLNYDKKAKAIFNLVKEIRSLTNGDDILYYLPPGRNWIQVSRDFIFFKFICGIDKMVGFKKAVRKQIIRKKGKLVVLPKESESLLDAISCEEKSIHGDAISEFPNDLKRRMDSILDDDFIKIAIGSGTKDVYRKWPVQKYKELCKKIMDIKRTKIFFVGGESDRGEGDAVLEGIPIKRALNLAGRANILESAYLFKKCNLFIGNNSGNLHLAASMNIPTIGIYSSGFNPGRWNPIGTESFVFQKEIACEGCLSRRCAYKSPECLEKITVDEVFKKVLEIIENNP